MRNGFLGCGNVVGGAGDPNHSAWCRFLVFLLKNKLFCEIFHLTLLRGFYSQNSFYVQKKRVSSPVWERRVSAGRGGGCWAGRHRFWPPKTKIFVPEKCIHCHTKNVINHFSISEVASSQRLRTYPPIHHCQIHLTHCIILKCPPNERRQHHIQVTESDGVSISISVLMVVFLIVFRCLWNDRTHLVLTCLQK